MQFGINTDIKNSNRETNVKYNRTKLSLALLATVVSADAFATNRQIIREELPVGATQVNQLDIYQTGEYHRANIEVYGEGLQIQTQQSGQDSHSSVTVIGSFNIVNTTQSGTSNNTSAYINRGENNSIDTISRGTLNSITIAIEKGSDNSFEKIQHGYSNRATTDTYSENSSFNIRQFGSFNTTFANSGSGAERNYLWTMQDGQENYMIAGISGISDMTIAIQRGDNNTAFISSSGDDNFIDMLSEGNNNYVSIGAHGISNDYIAIQMGDGNTTSVDNTSRRNYESVYNEFDAIIIGNENSVDVVFETDTRDAHQNGFNAFISGDFNTAESIVNGMLNMQTAYMHGTNNQFYTHQDGYMNAATFTGAETDNVAMTMRQYGSFNTAIIDVVNINYGRLHESIFNTYQDGRYNTIDVFIDSAISSDLNVTQIGHSNTFINFKEDYYTAFGGQIDIVTIGDNNFIEIDSTGYDAVNADIELIGDNNLISIDSGYFGVLRVDITGENAFDNSIYLHQEFYFSHFDIEYLEGTGNTINAIQLFSEAGNDILINNLTGNYNELYVHQNAGDFYLDLTGDNNFLNITQARPQGQYSYGGGSVNISNANVSNSFFVIDTSFGETTTINNMAGDFNELFVANAVDFTLNFLGSDIATFNNNLFVIDSAQDTTLNLAATNGITDNNTIFIDQDGQAPNSSFGRESLGNVIDILLDGSDNILNVVQSGYESSISGFTTSDMIIEADYSEIQLQQEGMYNSVMLEVYADHSSVSILQDGNNNIAAVIQL